MTRWVSRWRAATLLAIAALTAISIFLIGRERSSSEADRDDSRGLPYLLPDLRALDLTYDPSSFDRFSNEPTQNGLAQIYGNPSTSDPFEHGDLLVSLSFDGDVPPKQPWDTPVTVGGHDGTLFDETPRHGPLVLSWADDEGNGIQLASHSLGTEELLAIGDGLQLLADRRVRLSPLPARLQLLFEQELRKIGAGALRVVPTFDGYELHYSSPMTATGVHRRLVLSVLATRGDHDLDLIRWFGLPDVSEIVVRNKPALLSDRGTLPKDVSVRGDSGPEEVVELPLLDLTWQERPGVVVGLGSIGLNQEELIAVAEGLRGVSRGEWTETVE